MVEKTFGMIKPEGMQYSSDIEDRIYSCGLEIIEIKELVLTGEQFELIYGHSRERIPDVYDSLKSYMTSRPVAVMCVSGEGAVEKLLELRGASNAVDAKPGTIRGDYAKDQDYTVLYVRKEFARNVFHAADASEAEKMVRLFFGDL